MVGECDLASGVGASNVAFLVSWGGHCFRLSWIKGRAADCLYRRTRTKAHNLECLLFFPRRHRLPPRFLAFLRVRRDRYPAESCAMLEEVWLGWCPHLAEVEALLLKIRKAGLEGQVGPWGA